MEYEIIEEKAGLIAKLHTDESCDVECPLDWEQEAVKFLTWERNSTLSDYNDMEREEVERLGNLKQYSLFPLYKYEHGGVAYSVGGFSCPWDSGQVGYVLVIDAQVGGDPREAAQGVCDQVTSWCNGDIWGFTVEDEEGEELYSCWGFIGDTDYVKKAARDHLDGLIKERGEQLELTI